VTALGPVTALTGPITAGRPPAPPTAAAVDDGRFAAALGRATASTGPAAASVAAPRGLSGRLVLDAALVGLGRTAPTVADGPGPGPAFVAAAYRRVGVVLPADLAGQAATGVAVASLGQARSGDLVVLGRPPDAIGVYAGQGRVVMAPAEGGPARLVAIEGPVAAIRRVVDDPASEPSAIIASSSTGAAPPGAPGAGRAAGSLADVPYGELFERAAAAHGVDAALLAAMARAESGFDPRAVSRAGAQGLMQFMPGTAAGLGVDPWDPGSAIDGAARYLRSNLDRFGTVELALAAYNAGPGAVQRHGGIPPFPETQRYVGTVLDTREQYLR
jgi:peptidoglycan DL-endopeptidase CwlO